MRLLKWLYDRWPELMVFIAHVGAALICVYLKRWDLLAVGIVFGVPSTLLFMDISREEGWTVRLVKWITRL